MCIVLMSINVAAQHAYLRVCGNERKTGKNSTFKILFCLQINIPVNTLLLSKRFAFQNDQFIFTLLKLTAYEVNALHILMLILSFCLNGFCFYSTIATHQKQLQESFFDLLYVHKVDSVCDGLIFIFILNVFPIFLLVSDLVFQHDLTNIDTEQSG